MKTITLLSEAWFRDNSYEINFPDNWDVEVIGDQIFPSLTDEEIKHRINNPIGSQPLDQIVKPGSRAAIIVDDLTRPTPVELPVKLILAELLKAGINHESIVIVVGSGSHAPASENELRLKLGTEILSRYRIIPHNCRENLVDLGRTTRGTPLFINREVASSDLKIGIGCVYPHPAAGFSGGSKIIAPAVAGAETIQFMHDHLLGANRRAGSMDTEFHREIDDIAERIGLDYIANMVLTIERNIAGIFCGDKRRAHLEAVNYSRSLYTVEMNPGADIVVADMYPFDIDLQFSHDRGFWPLLDAGKNSSKVIISACPKGVGRHELYPVSKSILSRYSERIMKLNRRDMRSPLRKLRKLRLLYRQKNIKYLFFSTGVREDDLAGVFPNAEVYREWNPLLDVLTQTHSETPVKAVLYRCAPLLIPNRS